MTCTDYLYPEDLPAECISDCSASGDVTEAVTHWVRALPFAVDPSRARRALAEYGAWTRAELAAWDAEELALRVLWLACCDFNEGQDIFSLVG